MRKYIKTFKMFEASLKEEIGNLFKKVIFTKRFILNQNSNQENLKDILDKRFNQSIKDFNVLGNCTLFDISFDIVGEIPDSKYKTIEVSFKSNVSIEDDVVYDEDRIHQTIINTINNTFSETTFSELYNVIQSSTDVISVEYI